MLRKFMFLPLALPVALFVGCQGTAQNDSATTDSALESCFSASSDGATKCALQTGAFSRDSQDVDHDGRPDGFVCAHIVKIPHGALGAGGASGAPSAGSGDGHPSVPPVPTDSDCDRMGCEDQRPHRGGPGVGGADGQPDPTSGPAAPDAAETAPTTTPAGDGDDMTCPGHGSQGGGQGPQGGDGAGGAGAPAGHGPGQPGAGGAGAR